MKRTVVLFQPYIRQFVLNFGLCLKHFEFRSIAKPVAGGGYHRLPNFDGEVLRRKDHFRNRLRRFLGVPNVRIWMKNEGDLLFTYGCLIFTKKPYCTYVENGLALYNYDLGIAKNPLAKALVTYLLTQKNCKKLIFLSEAAYKSFYATVRYPKRVLEILKEKSTIIYPLPVINQKGSVKSFSGKLRLVFPGQFYIKGGLQVARAFSYLRERYGEAVELTVITALHMLKNEDHAWLKTIPGLTLLDAKLSGEEMAEVYKTHDILLLPTYREGFGLVLIEAISYGLPLIITDQFATAEMLVPGKNGFAYPNHPLKDYDPESYRLLGKYYNPKDFYTDLFSFDREGKLDAVEKFLEEKVSLFLEEKTLLEEQSRNSLTLYQEKFSPSVVAGQIEAVFLEAVEK